MLYLSPLLALVSLVVAPALLVVSYRMRWRVFPATWDGQQREGDVAQIVDEDVNGVRVVKAFGQEQRELERVVGAAQTLYGSQMRAVRLQARYQPLLEAIPSLGQVAILALGGWLALHARDHPRHVPRLLDLRRPARGAGPPARRRPHHRPAGPRRGRAHLPAARPAARPSPTRPTPSSCPSCAARSTSTTCTSATATVRRCSRLRPAHRAGRAGRASSGRAAAASRPWPCWSSRFYDPDRGARAASTGTTCATVTLRSLRRQVGVVFEESFLFSDTVRANIAYGRPDATDAEIEAAARAAAGRTTSSSELPRGYDTVVGERGLTLSGGQRQRIALARAILTDPRILILDDATSAVDARTEEAIHDALREVLAGRTTLLVAHRRSTLHLADRIVVLDGGRVVEQGTHDELLERSAALPRRCCPGSRRTTPRPGRRPDRGAGRARRRRPRRAAAAAATARTGGASDRSRRADVSPARRASAPGSAAAAGRLAAQPGADARAAGPGRRAAAGAGLPPTVDLGRETAPRPAFSLRAAAARVPPAAARSAWCWSSSTRWPRWPARCWSRPASTTASRPDRRRCCSRRRRSSWSSPWPTWSTRSARRSSPAGPPQRIMLSLRIRIWAQLQRLSLDYYEREMAGRIMTRMTTDVDQFESLIENGLLSALVSLVTFVGVGVALVLIDARARPAAR